MRFEVERQMGDSYVYRRLPYARGGEEADEEDAEGRAKMPENAGRQMVNVVVCVCVSFQ